MDKFKHIRQIKEAYDKGENMINFLKKIKGNKINDIEDILISYDLQSGSYIKNFLKNTEYVENYTNLLAKEINSIGSFQSILEVGVGEATTLAPTISKINNIPLEILGLDISWSRLKFANEFLKEYNLLNSKLFTSNLFEIPLKDNSIDIVYTSHSLEPNGGKEKEALKELYRISKKYIILLEPSYEFATIEGKKRMKKHGYISNLYNTIIELKYNIIEHRLFEKHFNPLNPTAITIIEKRPENINSTDFICPISSTELKYYNDNLLYSKDSYIGYPVIEKIPCLLKSNSIMLSHLMTNYNQFKQINGIQF